MSKAGVMYERDSSEEERGGGVAQDGCVIKEQAGEKWTAG